MSILHDNLITIKKSFAAIRDKFKASWGIDFTGRETAEYADIADELSAMLVGTRTEWVRTFKNTNIKVIPPLDYSNAVEMWGTFEHCTGINGDVTINGGVEYQGLFKDCTNIKNAYITPRQDTDGIITEYIFCRCENLIHAEINTDSNSCRSFSTDYAFYKCGNLETVKYLLTAGNTRNRFTINHTFFNCSKLVTLSEPIVLTNLAQAHNAFSGCTQLRDVEFQGKLGISLDLSDCVNLSPESLHSLMNTLSDNTNGRILNIGSTNIDKLTADYPEDIPGAEEKGWAIV